MTASTLRAHRKSIAALAGAILEVAAAGTVVALLAGHFGPEVLKAASGNSIVKPQNGDLISTALNTVNGNALWIMVTGIGTAITVVGVALAFGVRDASNWAFRIAGAVLIVFVVGPAVVA